MNYRLIFIKRVYSLNNQYAERIPREYQAIGEGCVFICVTLVKNSVSRADPENVRASSHMINMLLEVLKTARNSSKTHHYCSLMIRR